MKCFFLCLCLFLGAAINESVASDNPETPLAIIPKRLQTSDLTDQDLTVVTTDDLIVVGGR